MAQIYIFATWCDVSGLDIKEHKNTSVMAKLTTQNLRHYACFGFLLQDDLDYGLDPNSILVFDYKNKKYIEAKKAFFVLTQNVYDPLSKYAKIAFSTEKDANDYIKNSGGKLLSFAQVWEWTKKNLAKDRANFALTVKKRYEYIGKNVYEKCKKNLSADGYFEIKDLKQDLSTNLSCGKLKELYLHSLSLYLWNNKKKDRLDTETISVSKDDKCPVCGMFVSKYPRWVAQIHYKNPKHILSFDGVKDLMKFYFEPSRWGKYPFATKSNINKILVTDYYLQKAIDARGAFYVIKSNVYGPMGHELIPFEEKELAKDFLKDHGGEIIEFDKIRSGLPYEMDKY